jgi:diadenosine tetraphosphatase ApaH/serine/threonine PP2A family protein phosphatase
MKIALLADLHANLTAVRACMAHAESQGAEGFAFLGDLVGYGPEPAEVVELVAEHAARGAVVVRGNHDAAVVNGRTGTMDKAAAAAVAWTRERLGQAGLGFLAQLPLTVRREGALFVHATADEPESWTYVTDALRAGQSIAAAGASWTFGGHVHVPALYYAGADGRAVHFNPVPGVRIPIAPRRRWLAVVGSAGQPRDGNPAACYAMADLADAALTFYRVPYDVARAAASLRASGLPARLAVRLERGR